MLLRKISRGLLIGFCVLLGMSTMAAVGMPSCQFDYDFDGDVDGQDLHQFGRQFDGTDIGLLTDYFGYSICDPFAPGPEDIDLGLFDNEQQGGGGLVADGPDVHDGLGRPVQLGGQVCAERERGAGQAG